VFRARWTGGKDLADDQTLIDAAEAAGMNGDALVAALDEPRWAHALDQQQADAKADGVFGVPFFVYEDHHFWGNDRIEWLVRELQKR
jgi:2-hydroxychromene-2-carboxylate isomerase